VPRKSASLISTDREVYAAKPPSSGRAEYRVSGSPGLVLRVTPDGRRSWVAWLKRRKTGKWQKYTIGPYPAVTLARARNEMTRLRTLILDGVDPFDARDAGKSTPTLRVLGATFIARHAKPKKRSWEEDERKLSRDVYPALGDCRADLVTKPDVVRFLDAIHDRGAPIHANRTLALLRKLYNWAIAEGYLECNPAIGVPVRAKEQIRRRVLTEEEVHLFWNALKGRGFESVTADALRLQLLLGARIREVTGMTVSELVLDAHIPTWTLPAARAKGNRDVARRLPPMALAIVMRRLVAAGRSPFVFASPADERQPIISKAPTRAVYRAGIAGLILPLNVAGQRKRQDLTLKHRAQLWHNIGFTPHDLRRTCRTFWAKLGISETVAKKILGHSPPKADVTASVYDQHTYLPEMLEALRRWETALMEMVGVGDRAGIIPVTMGVAA
jgi:integrase